MWITEYTFMKKKLQAIPVLLPEKRGMFVVQIGDRVLVSSRVAHLVTGKGVIIVQHTLYGIGFVEIEASMATRRRLYRQSGTSDDALLAYKLYDRLFPLPPTKVGYHPEGHTIRVTELLLPVDTPESRHLVPMSTVRLEHSGGRGYYVVDATDQMHIRNAEIGFCPYCGNSRPTLRRIKTKVWDAMARCRRCKVVVRWDVDGVISWRIPF